MFSFSKYNLKKNNVKLFIRLKSLLKTCELKRDIEEDFELL